MKSTRRHELETNVLADSLGRWITRAKPHGRLIGWVAALVVLLVVVFLVVPAFRGGPSGEEVIAASFAAAMATQTDEALRGFLQDFPDARQVPAARIALADRLFGEAVRRTDADGRPIPSGEADARLAEARQLYREVAEKRGRNEPLARMKLGLVLVQEGGLEKGRAALEEVAKTWPDTAAAVVAGLHLDGLKGYRPVTFSAEPLESDEPDEAEGAGDDQTPSASTPEQAQPEQTEPEKQPAGEAPAANQPDNAGETER